MTGVFFLIQLIPGQATGQVIRQPYLQSLSQEGITIMWQTGTGERGKVWYGTGLSSLEQSKAESEEEEIYHEVELTGLAPATKYYYSVDSAESSDQKYFITSPLPGERGKTRIWVISDFGQTTVSQNAAREQVVDHWKTFNDGDTHANFILSLGDQTENDTREELQQTFFDQLQNVLLNSPLFTIEGNHDTHDDLVNYKATFTNPSHGEAGGYPSESADYWSFDYGNIHVIGLSTEIDDINGAQLTWLQKDLQQIDPENTDWLIACLHRPFHSGGYHATDESATAQKQRDYWLTELEDHGVDLILQGHNAIYERSFLLDNLTGKSTDMTEENLIDGGDGREDGDGVYYKGKGLNPHQGTVFIEVAPGGDAVSNNEHYGIFATTLSGSDVEGSLVVDVDGSGRMDVFFLCNKADAEGNHTRDYFTIVKTDSIPSLGMNPSEVKPDILIRNYPNPFENETTITYRLRERGPVKIEIFDLLGQLIDIPVNETAEAGEHNFTWNAVNLYRNFLPAGFYMAKLTSGNMTAVTRLLTVKGER